MSEQGVLLLGCMALPVLIIAVGMVFHRRYNRPMIASKRKPAR